MRADGLIGIFIVAFLAGGIVTFLGFIIRFFNISDILNFFDEKRHDKDKASEIVGRDFLVMGISVIIVPIISIFVDAKYYKFMIISQACIIIVGFIITYYQFFRYCKK